MVQIPKVSFNTFQAQPQSSGASFNPLQSIGQAVGGVAQAVQTNERNALIQKKELEQIQFKRDKRDADAFENEVAVNTLIMDTEAKERALSSSNDFSEQWKNYSEEAQKYKQSLIKVAPNQQAIDRIEAQSVQYMKKAYTEMNKASVTQNINRRKAQIEDANTTLSNSAYDPQYSLDDLLNINDSNHENSIDTLGKDEAEKSRVKNRNKIIQERIRYFDTQNDLEALSQIRTQYSQDLTNADKARIDGKIKTEKDRQDKLLKESPANYVFEMAQQQGGIYDVQAAVDIQKQQKIRPEAITVLPDEYVKTLSANLQEVDSVQEMQSWLEKIEEVATPEYLPNAFRDLEKAGIPRQYKGVMSFMPQSADHNPTILDTKALSYLFEYNRTLRNKGDFKANFNDKLMVNNHKATDFNSKLVEGLDGYLNVLKSEGMDPIGKRDLSETMKIIAQSHYMENGDIDEAIRFTQQAYTQDYHADVGTGGFFGGKDINWPTVDGHSLRIPRNKVADPQDVVTVLEDWKENNIDSLLAVTSQSDPDAVRSIKQGIMNNSYFALNQSEDGVVLYNASDNTRQKDENGKFIELKFEDIIKKRKSMRKGSEKLFTEELTKQSIEELKQTEQGLKTLQGLGLGVE